MKPADSSSRASCNSVSQVKPSSKWLLVALQRAQSARKRRSVTRRQRIRKNSKTSCQLRETSHRRAKTILCHLRKWIMALMISTRTSGRDLISGSRKSSPNNYAKIRSIHTSTTTRRQTTHTRNCFIRLTLRSSSIPSSGTIGATSSIRRSRGTSRGRAASLKDSQGTSVHAGTATSQIPTARGH